ncbi:Rab43 protein [Jimgerdemannia flammicorona]|uniref:Rab43 protein n=1 Tax=Jimgerdemannia flammicorona TaxID=994334 RepID=A0A433QVI3_9FUNG|nr:Rab43 protein [Jimgerdemannia flammicorona]
MARNEEKAQSMLYRFREAQAAELGVVKQRERRPHLASNVNNLGEAEKWRRQVISEVSRKVSKIQDAGLSDYQVRDLNDEINKLMREKMYWENRIKELGGPDYWKIGPRMLDKEGREVPGNRGYKYVWRLYTLAEQKTCLAYASCSSKMVRTSFFTYPPKKPHTRGHAHHEILIVINFRFCTAPEAPKRTRFDMYRNVDADYYGYRDEEDGALLEYEHEREREWAQRALAAGESEFVTVEEEAEEAEVMEVDTEEENPKKAGKKGKGKKAEEPAEEGAGAVTDKYVAHVAVPSQKEVEEYLVRRRRQQRSDFDRTHIHPSVLSTQLLDKYVSEDLEESAKETRELTGMS